MAALIVAVVIFAGVATLAVARWQAYRFRVAPTEISPRPFDSVGWASGSATLRHEMAHHLTATGELTGRSKAEIIGQLGPPNGEDRAGVLDWHLGERQDPTGRMWNYDEFLRIYFDERGMCRESVIWGKD